MSLGRVSSHLLVLAVAGLLLAGCAGGAASAWDGFVQRYLDSYFEANPHAAVDAGRHEFDGQLPDWSEDGLRAEIERLKGFRQQAGAFDPSSLDDHRRLEREHLLAQIDGSLFWFETAEWPWRNPAFYGRALDPNVYVSRPYAPLPERMQAFTKWAANTPQIIAQARANLRTPIPKTFVQLGRAFYGGMAAYLRDDVPGVFAGVEGDDLRAEFESATAAAVEAFKEMEAWLKTQEATATDDFALGVEKFKEMLWTNERVDVPLDRLEEIGRVDLERNSKALKEACTEYAPGQSIRQCILRVQGNKPEQGAVQGARDQLDGLEKFLRDNKLVSIPGTERALVEEAPPYRRSNAAYINIPGPYEKGLPSVYYIAPPDPDWTAKEQADYIPGETDLLFISVHEVWPGHFLHFLHANRSPSWIGRIFIGYAFAEGWAHYTEELMWEAGFNEGDAETHIGQLINALLRNVRYLSAIGLHARGMTVAESEKMFLEKAYQDPGNARQQAARGTYDPGYLNYTLGKLMIRKMRADWTADRGGREAWGAFHDEFLSFGGPPIPLVRKAMLGDDAGPNL